MPVFKRKDIPKLVETIEEGKVSPVYLIFGERFLCRNAADELVSLLLPPGEYQPEQKTNHLQDINGDQEDTVRTLNLLRTYSLFPGRHLFRISDTKLFYSKGVAKALWDKANDAYAAKEMSRAASLMQQLLDLADLSPADQETADIPSIASNQWKKMFGFTKPQQNLSWMKDVLDYLRKEHVPAAQHKGNDASDLYVKAYEEGLPKNNILILLAETVDKRKQFYNYIKKNGVILDLTIEGGSSSAARKDQESVLQQLVQKTLADFNKKLEPKALPLLLERVGFHPVAVVMETEKLALYSDQSPIITREDLDAVVGRTREEALYELTDAFMRRQLAEALIILFRLLENGIHALAILAAFRNQIKKMLLIRSFQELTEPAYKSGLPFPAFQKSYLPDLKAGREEWALLWRIHPYALYKMFLQTEHFSRISLEKGMRALLISEYRIKGSNVTAQLILEDLLFKLIPQ